MYTIFTMKILGIFGLISIQNTGHKGHCLSAMVPSCQVLMHFALCTPCILYTI